MMERDPGLLGQFIDWVVTAILGLIGVIYAHNNHRITKLEAAVPSEFERTELTRQRQETHDNIALVFQKLDEMSERQTKRHIELLELIHQKADK